MKCYAERRLQEVAYSTEVRANRGAISVHADDGPSVVENEIYLSSNLCDEADIFLDKRFITSVEPFLVSI